MTEEQQPTIAQLQQELRESIAAIREEAKEREPSVLGAIRTLTGDVHAWQKGERDIPRSAAIGLAFAYLRPRVILAIGSVAALIVAVAQIFLVYKQNEIISRQNKIMSAQVTAALLPELSRAPATAAQRAYYSAYGDVALEVAVGTVLYDEVDTDGAEEGQIDYLLINSAQLIAMRAEEMDDYEEPLVLERIVRTLQEYAALWAKRHDQLPLWTSTIGDTVKLTRSAKKGEPDGEASRQLSAAIRSLAYSLNNVAGRRVSINVVEKFRWMEHKFLEAMTAWYIFAIHENRYDSMRRAKDDVDGFFKAVCVGMRGGETAYDLERELLQMLTSLAVDVPHASTQEAVKRALERNCSVPDEGVEHKKYWESIAPTELVSALRPAAVQRSEAP